MFIPVAILWERFIDAVVEVLVVRKNNMPTDIVELLSFGLASQRE
jgi:hypothetical protein